MKFPIALILWMICLELPAQFYQMDKADSAAAALFKSDWQKKAGEIDYDFYNKTNSSCSLGLLLKAIKSETAFDAEKYMLESFILISGNKDISGFSLPDSILDNLSIKFEMTRDQLITKITGECFYTIPQIGLYFLNKQAESFISKGNKPMLAFSVFNQAMLNNEVLMSSKVMVLSLLDSVINIWAPLNDTLQMANVYKYKGLVLSQSGDFGQAALYFNEAIQMFRSKSFDAGIYSCRLDMIQLYRESGLCDSVRSAAVEAAHNFGNEDYFRLFVSATFSLQSECFTEDECEVLVERNLRILENNDLPLICKIDFCKAFKANQHCMQNKELTKKMRPLISKTILEASSLHYYEPLWEALK